MGIIEEFVESLVDIDNLSVEEPTINLAQRIAEMSLMLTEIIDEDIKRLKRILEEE